MALKVRKKSSKSLRMRAKRKRRVRGKILGTTERPRVSVFRSNLNFSGLLVDDTAGKTVLHVSTLGKKSSVKNNIDGVKELGKSFGEGIKKLKIESVVFDRNGYLYHGKVKAFADGIRESGIRV